MIHKLIENMLYITRRTQTTQLQIKCSHSSNSCKQITRQLKVHFTSSSSYSTFKFERNFQLLSSRSSSRWHQSYL